MFLVNLERHTRLSWTISYLDRCSFNFLSEIPREREGQQDLWAMCLLSTHHCLQACPIQFNCIFNWHQTSTKPGEMPIHCLPSASCFISFPHFDPTRKYSSLVAKAETMFLLNYQSRNFFPAPPDSAVVPPSKFAQEISAKAHYRDSCPRFLILRGLQCTGLCGTIPLIHCFILYGSVEVSILNLREYLLKEFRAVLSATDPSSFILLRMLLKPF